MSHSIFDPRRSPRRRGVLLASFAVVALGASSAFGQAWPSKKVTVIVPFPPGGPADASARVLSEVMARQLGQPIVVENRPGAGSAIGTQAAVQSNDGHTLLMGSTSMTILPALRSDLPFNVQKDLQPIGMVSTQPLVLVVAENSPLKTLDDVIARGRAGGALTSGNSGNGSLSHLTTELFNLKMGTKIVSVPYKGESVLIPDIIGGNTDMAFANLPSALPLLKTGRLRALAVTSSLPLPALPGVRTLKSLGQPEFVVEGWAALFAAQDVPLAGVERMEKLLQLSLAEPPVRTRFDNLGVTPAPGTHAALAAFVRSEIARWTEVVRTRGIKLE